MSTTLLIATKVGFEIEDKTFFKDVTLSIGKNDRIGLIGRNGEGKSTLLKFLAGVVQPPSGRIESSSSTYYLPQLDLALFENKATIADFLHERHISWPLFQASLHKLFGIDWLTQDQSIYTLSGGELAKLLITLIDVKRPSILFLDEPTNHLDIEGLEVLKQFLLDFQGTYVVVSHDPLFLNHVVRTIWELKEGSLSIYGGDYTHYEEQIQIAEDARERNLEVARKGVKKVKRAIVARGIRASRASREEKRSKSEDNRDKFAEGFFKGRSEVGTGRDKVKLDRKLEEAERKVGDQKKKVGRKIHLNLDVEGGISKRLLLKVTNGKLTVGSRVLLNNIQLHIAFGDRVVITGPNGSGKSTFLRSLIGASGVGTLEGEVEKAESLQAVYMAQKYQSIDPSLSVLDNMLRENGAERLDEAKAQLGRFLFRSDADVGKLGGVLSGGEAARLTLAMVTAKPIDLLILDEPTNNLDIETLDIIASALEDFPGSLIVISHNIHFLAQLGISSSYVFRDQALKRMVEVPQDQEPFYTELVSYSGK